MQKYLTVSHHQRLFYSLITNAKFWDSLPADVRPGLDRAVKETAAYFNDTASNDNDSAMTQIKATGKMEIHVLTDSEKKAWIAALMPVHQEMQSRFGKDFIDRVYKASGFVPPQA